MLALVVNNLGLDLRASSSVAPRPGGGSSRSAACAVAHRQHEVGNARSDFGAETRTVEHAVMTHAGLQPVRLPLGRKVDAQPVRGFGLSDAGNIVVLALDREQRH